MPVVIGSSTNETVADLISETRRHLGSMARGLLNKLSSGISAAATTLTTSYTLQGITQSSYIAIDDEIILVWSTNGTTGITAMERGQLGSIAATHNPGTLIEVQPRFPQFSISQALRQEIASWPSSKLWRVGQLSITLAVSQRAYDLVGIPADFYDVLEVDISPATTDLSRTWKEPRWRVQRGPTATFPSGAALIIDNPVTVTGQTLEVTYSAPFDLTPWASNTQVETDLGLPASATDIPPLGAAGRLMATKEIHRTDTAAQGESRNSAEVPPFHMHNTAKALFDMRDKRLDVEANRLRGKYPIRFF